MRLPDEGYYSAFRHVEVGRYFPDLERVARITKKVNGEKIPVLISWDDIYDFSAKYDDLGIYHSLRYYDLKKGGLDGPSLAPLHFDIDNEGAPELALRDTYVITNHLVNDLEVPAEAVTVYFSGMKGYHIEIDPLAIRLNLVHDNSAAVFRHIAETFEEELELTSLDYMVYDLRRIWRLAGSRHQKTGLYKMPCRDMVLNGATVDAIAEEAKQKPTLEQLAMSEQKFSYKAARRFADMVADYEAERRQREQDKLSNFLAHGGVSKKFEGDVVKQFTAADLCLKCPAVDALVVKAKTQKNLEHYERLFLCSLLTYTPEAIEFLHSILSELDDYNFEISDLHIQDWIRRREYGIGGRPYTCEKAKTVGIICSGCYDLEPKSYENKYGAEHLADPSPVRFAYKHHQIEGKS